MIGRKVNMAVFYSYFLAPYNRLNQLLKYPHLF